MKGIFYAYILPFFGSGKQNALIRFFFFRPFFGRR
jgi:hypothetical protein